uniref:Cytochrome f n=1 Tax=Haptophyceae sp. NIES-3900 TaxID=2748608 RepID=A0A7R7AJL9_9EUKA|nr:apocytochrome f [Haptophyceae sp. NIES-3900]
MLALTLPNDAKAYPIYAQQAYENPREATGRIVCANCHLAQKPVELEAPQAVLPDTVFEAVVKIPYDLSKQQIQGNGTKGPLNVGSVMVLPEGFQLAPKDRLSKEIKKKTKGAYVQPYSKERPNILIVGPVPGDQNQEIIFPILSPDPAQDSKVNFLNYPIYVGGNRGRGQIYPSGEKSNNGMFVSPAAGQITSIKDLDKGRTEIVIQTSDKEVTQVIPAGLEIKVKAGDIVTVDQPLTPDPNVGGFGQAEIEIILQDPLRVKGMIAFFFSIIIAQIFLVLKKKQFEKVQAAEMNF